ncbi:MAG: hypothetical protein HZC40_21415 [Chloroflexi bacterium]|nr:hypothetical protein [Chloroflexota bacterium]
MNLLDSLRMDKTAFSVASLDDKADEKAYWLSKTPYERLEAIEIMRQIIYGYNPSSTRLQRFFTVTPLASS